LVLASDTGLHGPVLCHCHARDFPIRSVTEFRSTRGVSRKKSVDDPEIED
jgi:hypothetical protein